MIKNSLEGQFGHPCAKGEKTMADASTSTPTVTVCEQITSGGQDRSWC